MSKHNVRGTASGEYECGCGARWDRDEGEECPMGRIDGKQVTWQNETMENARVAALNGTLPEPKEADHDEHGNRVEALAAFIRGVDGNNRMGAGALAERIIEWQARAALSGNPDEKQAKHAPYMSDDADPRETWAEGYNAAMRNA